LSSITYAQPGPANSVNPFIGTGGHGHTFPGATVPFGMVQLSPDTRNDASWDGSGGYHYDDTLIYGFSHTHLSGTGVSDYGDILIQPINNNFDPTKKNVYRFSHEKESATAGYYSVSLKEPIIDAELTATERTGYHNYHFRHAKDSAGVIIDLRFRDELIDAQLYQIDARHLGGFRRSSAWAKDQLLYFYIEFSEDVRPDNMQFDSLVLAQDEKKLQAWSGRVAGGFRFKLGSENILQMKVALSSVSVEGARKNMKAENPDWDFALTKQEAISKWNKELGKIEIVTDDKEAERIFYTALYHCMVVPNVYNDVDGRYRGRDKKIHKTATSYYTVFSLWDTFRAWHPLMTIIDQKRTVDFVRTFLAQYEQAGLLPVWEFASNETECMIGYHSVSVIADAAAKNISGFDKELALNAAIKSATAKDRFGLDALMDHGYLDVMDEAESVSKTLEYSYDDFCISRLASQLGNEKVKNEFLSRSNNWKNLFDPTLKFVRPRRNGGFLTPFDPREVNNNYTEANAWQYTFFVPQDIPGLKRMMGGDSLFTIKLNTLFSEPTQTTGREQADITGLIGQYAQGNEPSHHMVYLYNYTNERWKTQFLVNQIRKDFYTNKPDGLIGNEDCGQMSAWLVMSALGMYQVCPGVPVFELTSPMFREVILHLENGNTLRILGERYSEVNKFISEVKLNDEPIQQLSYSQLMAGGDLKFYLTDERGKWKNEERKMTEERMANSYDGYVISPSVYFSNDNFRDSTVVTMSCVDGAKVHYTLDGSLPDAKSKVYSDPIVIKESCQLTSVTIDAKGNKSYLVKSNFHKNAHPDWKVKISSTYSKQYSAGGDEGLIDGVKGDAEWRKGGWQGYQDQDFEAVIDLGEEKKVSTLSGDFLQDVRSWILMPTHVIFSTSADGVNFTQVADIKNDVADTTKENMVKTFMQDITPTQARYVKVKAINYGPLPQWHPGAGYPAYIFVDEIEIK
jgi:predicted alpha-1,2-mannosidase